MRVKLAASRRAEIEQAVRQLSETQGKVGWLPSAVYEGGQPVAGIAAIQEFGSAKRGIPPRPFFRTTIDDKSVSWKRTAAQISKAILQGNLAPSALTEAVSLAAEGHVRATITKLTTPPLSLITIELRRRRRAGEKVTGKTVGDAAKAAQSAFFKKPSKSESKPLVDTGYLLETLTSETSAK